MGAWSEAREQIAAAATAAAGFPVTPYPPDSAAPPVGWVDQLAVQYDNGLSYCLRDATAQVVLVGSRHDRAGTTRLLEDAVPTVVAALIGLGGISVVSAETGIVQLNSEEVPAVNVSVAFALEED